MTNVAQIADHEDFEATGVSKWAFPLKPVPPSTLDFNRMHDIWTRIKPHLTLLDDDTIRDPRPFFASIHMGQTLLFELGDWHGLLWLHSFQRGRSGIVNIIIWDAIPLRRLVGPFQDAAREALKWIMDNTELVKLRAYIDPSNVSSSRLAQRVGFSLEGHMRKEVMRGGELRDILAYGLLREEIE